MEIVFERNWQKVMDLYPEAQSYLRCQLYPHWEAWALAFTHQFFNCSIQSTQRVEVYNAILKKSLNRTTSLMEVLGIIERLLIKESQFVRFNKMIGELPCIALASYWDHYFIAIDETELKQQRDINETNTSEDIFSEDLYDEVLIELTELVDESEIVQFHIGILAKRWFNDRAVEKNEEPSNECAISIQNGQDFGTFEHETQTDFSFIDSMCGQYVFTPRIQHHVKSHSLYDKGFGLMKKALNLAIETGRVTNVQHSENLVRTGSSNISNESINIDFVEAHELQVQTSQVQDQIINISKESIGIDVVEVHESQGQTSQVQDQIMHDQNEQNQGTGIVINNEDTLQSITQDKKKRVYICGNCGKDGHHRSRCPNTNSMKY
ncbi:hypothetical protein C2G38_2159161 [Gigaspora rosea]|uniref:CCHC-type domain-containing protein n=1 Tax=Gigaspora rosea TaxID=44941 RepID=A0A397W1A1_9GLOM|nr:hypothetical protein C2G38_2159161 [Gigaspora rosea]